MLAGAAAKVLTTRSPVGEWQFGRSKWIPLGACVGFLHANFGFFHRFQSLGDKMDWVVTFGHQPTWRLAASVACGLGECRARQVTWRHMIASVLLLTKSPMCVSANPRMAGGAWITCSYGGYAVARQATESQRAWCVYAPLGHTFGPPCWGRGHTRSRAAQSIGPLLQLWSYTRSVIDLRASPKEEMILLSSSQRTRVPAKVSEC